MAKLYPHKQTVAIFILCAVAVAATAVYVYGQSASQTNETGSVSVQPATTSLQEIIVTNTDWEKAFFVNSTSTSIAQKGNKSNTGAAANGSITATDKFGRQFLTEYANLKKEGKLDDADAVNAVTDKLLASDVLLSQPDEYSNADVKISAQNDAVSFRAYGNSIGSIVKYAPARNDAYIVSEGIQKGTEDYVIELDANISKYKNMIQMLLALRVPSELRESHLDFLNGVSTSLFIATSLRATPQDPVKALAGLSKQESGTLLLHSGYQGIRESLADKGITFEATEPGSYFNLKP